MKTITDKISTIVPVAHLELTAFDQRFMALVHLLRIPDYREFFTSRAEAGKYVILDNSTVELGEPWEMENYLDEAMAIGADEILLPDWLHSSTRTLSEAEHGLEIAERFSWPGAIMGVPQGQSQEEWVECLEQMLGMGITSIGVSRRYLDKFGESRLFACQLTYFIAQSMNIEVSIHLLGAGLPLEIEVAPCLRLPYVVGVDSAVASYFSGAEQNLRTGATRPDFQRDLEFDSYDPELIASNIAWWRILCAQQ